MTECDYLVYLDPRPAPIGSEGYLVRACFDPSDGRITFFGGQPDVSEDRVREALEHEVFHAALFAIGEAGASRAIDSLPGSEGHALDLALARESIAALRKASRRKPSGEPNTPAEAAAVLRSLVEVTFGRMIAEGRISVDEINAILKETRR